MMQLYILEIDCNLVVSSKLEVMHHNIFYQGKSSFVIIDALLSLIMNYINILSIKLENAIHYIKIEIKNLIQTGNVIFDDYSETVISD